ncbi:MAG: bifunctional 4-hydroxy-2-oxoglutarate aldolase/2-dehydro-3-deoxy-phosphogluconate aldolase [Chromatiaceae bacterium]|nr:bifunctional 4-hydroxy-2-oxoglutarate aldolase/2-dehydro-3-deoxy-phosphogluconate aldolase [Gammaproteobacteria bacterium]MCP5300305.1 bifunctional 4-hydroxy-2-oxoglutarate aldolase/2-dehydro-3-deoxy-phosphogluconate aldolase [Chromatiaceae bacterium]MCP5422376.1 bifunctional 4-hydroxy-2-oxoglutarate aldolase/2-dehydro-3-deoxy-phosphogluconate aldolase [Chromatiaceae bacterium]
MKIEEIVTATPALPVIVINRLEQAVPLARALLAGGIGVLEITLRTPVALDAVNAISEGVPEVIVGVGTLTRPEQFALAARAGAKFTTSPGLTRVLLNASEQSELPFLPGVCTPSEVMAARDVGFHCLKLFPAQQTGGIGMLKAIASPFADLKFCAAGGIGPENFRDFLALPNVTCVAGTWIAPAALIDAGNWDAITALARSAASYAG